MWSCSFDLLALQFFIIGANCKLLSNKSIHSSKTSISQYPFLAQLLLDSWGNHKFGQHYAGAIVTSRHILTAAHCFAYNNHTKKDYSDPKYWKVRVGSSYRTGGGATFKVKSIKPHQNFDKYYYLNNIALVVIHRRFQFNGNVKQVPIMRQGIEMKLSSLCQLAGWGVQEHNKPQSKQLEHTTMRTIDLQTCRDRYAIIGPIIQDSMFCTDHEDFFGSNGCFGDPGGPLTYKGVVVGIVSYGFGCDYKFFPGVYTKVSDFTNWVLKTIKHSK